MHPWGKVAFCGEHSKGVYFCTWPLRRSCKARDWPRGAAAGLIVSQLLRHYSPKTEIYCIKKAKSSEIWFAFSPYKLYIRKVSPIRAQRRDIAQPGLARLTGGQKVESSNLSIPTIFFALTGQKNMKPVKASLHAAAKRRFMHRRCASYGEAVLHKIALPDEAAPFHSAMKHCSANAPQYEALRFRSVLWENEKWEFPLAISTLLCYINCWIWTAGKSLSGNQDNLDCIC